MVKQLHPPFILREAISTSVADEMLAWVSYLYSEGRLTPNGDGRNYNWIKNTKPPVAYENARRGLASYLDIDDTRHPTNVPSHVSYMTDGGEIHPHTDPGEGRAYNFRCNLFLSTAAIGGQPIINGVEYTVCPRDVLCINASRDLHSSGLAKGGTPRAIISFAYLVDSSRFAK
jgi:hypothetical protein